MRSKPFYKAPRPSDADRKRANNAAFAFYGMPQFQFAVKEKRPRIRRADGRPLEATEHQEQKAVIDWWFTAHGLYRLPVFALFSVPNGSYLGSGFYAASTLKSEGMRPGAPDLMLAAPTPAFSGLFIEMKKIGGKAPSPEQTAFVEYLQSVGYSASVQYGAANAIKVIEEYLADLRP